MRIHPICPSCLLNRVYYESKLVTENKDLIAKCIEEALKLLCEEYPRKPINAYLATKIHKRVYQILQCDDPFFELKKKANDTSKLIVPMAEKIVSSSKDRIKAAIKIAIIGNVFDYGVLGHKVADEFEQFFIKKFHEELAIDDTEKIRELARGNVVYLTDNAGEIFFDAILMREIKKECKKLTVVVRGKPILNDATIEDAKLAGIDKIADEILTNGKGAIGIMLEELPEDTLSRLRNADLIISKGMANYECLSNSIFKPIAFLLTAKCLPIAEDLNVEVGKMVAKVIE
ncbi:MAG: ARMT1-like domain-containing protein [Archaeoglobales archaeon]|nr:ARMT1-like domain-containing protein [Archaeoglobales archaeon]